MDVDTLYTVGIALGLFAVIGLNLGLLYTLWAERKARHG